MGIDEESEIPLKKAGGNQVAEADNQMSNIDHKLAGILEAVKTTNQSLSTLTITVAAVQSDISRMLKKGYDRTRKQAEKRAIVVGVVKALQKKFGRTHDEIQIVKKWSDLKRRHPDWVKELSQRVCPGLPAPTVRRRLTTADLDVVEVSTEEDEQAGPSHSPQGATNPPDVGIVVEVSDEPGPSQGPKTSGPAPAEEEIATPAPKEEDEALSQFKDLQEPEAIIVAPTRELINQICLDAWKFAYGTVVRPVVIYGGTQTSNSLRQIFQGCNILCATPGRLLDVINKEKIGLSQVKYLVLYEADRMLDMGFMEDVRKLLSSQGMPKREERQTLMFSATFPTPIQNLAREILKPDYLFVVVGPVGGVCSDVEQQIIEVEEYGKRAKLLELLQLIGHERTMVFVKTKKMADLIAIFLCQEKIPCTSIHGDREQREREKALGDFRSGQCPVIVATSVAARGLDIENVLHVIHFDIPGDVDEYVHRIGRTGRCGNTGKAISFFNKIGDDEQKIVRGLVKVLTDAHQEVPLPAWLEEMAFSAHGMPTFSSQPSKFASVDSRKRGDIQEDNGYSNAGISQPAARAAAEEDEDWG
ncbi:probable ATP-dependent RNA helicase DDX4 [Bufo gargarizans]|uniref:probable ATP-dependent RNA helicase DDX4 n=1 Tax=Bufo gargarizans TaxID=30331 RepID=UPI001CF5777D|nr:probable ATP-dependent RNA helicase DDX4 [Bufo gargarizans]